MINLDQIDFEKHEEKENRRTANNPFHRNACALGEFGITLIQLVIFSYYRFMKLLTRR